MNSHKLAQQQSVNDMAADTDENYDDECKPHICFHQGMWRVEVEFSRYNLTACSDSIKNAWFLYLRMKAKRETGYCPTDGSSMQFSAI